MTMWHRATILSRRQLSPTVTGLTLQIDNQSTRFSFVPGQWLDFRPLPSPTWKPDGGKTVGGYSITSIPRSLPRLELAVQASRHPVAEWVTSRSRPNDSVDVRVGGTFTYACGFDNFLTSTNHEQAAVPRNRILFIAGGVGVNPLFSMIRQWHSDQIGKNDRKSVAMLLYSVGSVEELLFLNELDKLIDERPGRFHVMCTTTQKTQVFDRSNSVFRENNEKVIGVGGGNMVLKKGRVDLALIRESVSWLKKSDNIAASDEILSGERNLHGHGESMVVDAVFICGPPGMPESITKILSEEKFVRSTSDVHFEQWW